MSFSLKILQTVIIEESTFVSITKFFLAPILIRFKLLIIISMKQPHSETKQARFFVLPAVYAIFVDFKDKIY